SLIPARGIAVAPGPLASRAEALGIRPMGIATLDISDMTVQLTRAVDAAVLTATEITATEITENAPGALWAQTPFDPKKDQRTELIAGPPRGVQRPPPPPAGGQEPPAPKPYDEPPPGSVEWRYRYAIASYDYDPGRVLAHVRESQIESGSIQARRVAMLGALI